MNLNFNVKYKIVEILDSGEVELLSLYRSIREWEASETGIAFEEVIDGSGNIELPDGTKTSRTMIFVNEWRLSSKEDVSIVGGYVTGRDSKNKYTNPIVSESQFKINLLSNPTDESLFIPTEAQKGYAIEQGNLASKDWEIIIEPNPQIRRKQEASRDFHSIFGLYWFLKQEWLRNHTARGLPPPIHGDNQIPREGIVRRYELFSPWTINKDDLKYLRDGPLIGNGKLIIPETDKKEIINRGTIKAKSDSKEKGVLSNLKKAFSKLFDKDKTKIKQAALSGNRIKKEVTIGVVTALPIELATMLKQLDDPIDYFIKNGRFNTAV